MKSNGWFRSKRLGIRLGGRFALTGRKCAPLERRTTAYWTCLVLQPVGFAAYIPTVAVLRSPSAWWNCSLPEIRRKAASKQERSRAVSDPRHLLFIYKPSLPRLNRSRKIFLYCVDPLEGKITSLREEAWERKFEALPSSNCLNAKLSESLSSESTLEGKMWRFLKEILLEIGFSE